MTVIISIQCLNTWYSSAGYGVFRGWIWGIPLLDMRHSIWDMLLIGSDIEYIKLKDIHSYLDEIFPKLNTP